MRTKEQQKKYNENQRKKVKLYHFQVPKDEIKVIEKLDSLKKSKTSYVVELIKKDLEVNNEN